MLLRISIICFILLLSLQASAASPPKARTLSGIGLLLIRGGGKELTIYREPRLGRVVKLPAEQLPGPALLPSWGEGVALAVVLSARPGWLRIVYDAAESDGWVERRRSGEFLPWEEALKGAKLAMLPGLRADYYQLRREARGDGESLGRVEIGEQFSVLAVDGEWAKVSGADGEEGWLRWRDDNSRLMIRIGGVESHHLGGG